LNPGSQAWKACVLNQLDDDRHLDTSLNRKQQNKSIQPRAEEAVINTLIAIKANGIQEATCRQINYKLKELARHTDIFNPKAVKEYISEATNQITGEPLSQESRNKFAYAYSKFCEVHEIFWKRPYYKVDEITPLIPTTENVELIINNASQKYATIFTVLAETGAEGKELEKTDRDHIDTEQGIINITGTKGHGSGSYKLKKKTAEMLRIYLHKHPEKYPFPKSNIMGQVWRDTRKRTATKLCKPELNNIPLKNLSLDQIKDLISIMKKYPEQFGDFKDQRDQMLENLKKVELFLENA